MPGVEQREVGTSGLKVSTLGLGGAPLGDLFERLDDDVARATIAAAADSDAVTLFDTSPFYGFGLSEHRFGSVLSRRNRDSFQISTKVGRWLRPQTGPFDRGVFKGGLEFEYVFDYSYDGTMRSVEQSMARLGLTRFDILLVHDLDTGHHGEETDARFAEAMDGAVRALDDLKRQGVVKAIGVGLNEAPITARFIREGDFDCAMLAGRYTLLEQDALDEFLPLCEEKKVSMLAAGVFNSGILATGAVEGANYYYEPAAPEIMDRVRRIERVCDAHGVPIAVASAQFPLGHPRMASVVLGAVKPDEVSRNIAAMSRHVPAGLWDDLKSEKLLRADAPTP